jgi:hypothetical protein
MGIIITTTLTLTPTNTNHRLHHRRQVLELRPLARLSVS